MLERKCSAPVSSNTGLNLRRGLFLGRWFRRPSKAYWEDCGVQSLTLRNRSALLMTETELKLMAAPAIIGLRRVPVKG